MTKELDAILSAIKMKYLDKTDGSWLTTFLTN